MSVREEGRRIVIVMPKRRSFRETIFECQRQILAHALRKHRGNVSAVVRDLSMPRQTVYNLVSFLKLKLRRKSR